MYTLFVDTNLQACLKTFSSNSSSMNSSPTIFDTTSNTSSSSSIPSTSSECSSSSSIPSPSSAPIPPNEPKIVEKNYSQSKCPLEDLFSLEKVLLYDGWGFLYFNPTFVGEYKIPPREPKVGKEKDKEEPKKKPTLSRPLSNNFVATSKPTPSLICTLDDFDPQLEEKSPFLIKMAILYGLGFHILDKSSCRE